MEHTELVFDFDSYESNHNFDPEEFAVKLVSNEDVDCDGMCCSDCTVSSCTMHPNNLK